MKTFATYGILLTIVFSIALHQFRLSHLVVMYYMDNETFTEWFCENTNQPELACNGQCHLNKVAEESQTPENPLSLSFENEIVLFFHQPLHLIFFAEENFQKNIIFTEKGYIPNDLSTEAPPPWS